MANYQSIHTGPQIDRAISIATITGTVAPTNETVGIVGQFYNAGERLWLCASVENDLYNWKEIVLNAIGTWNQERIYNK